jgi:tRNA pseudouridine38-40 synthase
MPQTIVAAVCNREIALKPVADKIRFHEKMKVRHFKLTVAYDGAAYGGWQLQPNALTVQEVLEKALAKIAGCPVRVHGSGRTDAGVHARGQVANCSFATRLAPSVLCRALNANLAEDVRIVRAQEVDARFHARFSAKGKEYRYQIDCSAAANPFLRAYALHHPRPLDLAVMWRAAKVLKGRHDFSALSAHPFRPVENPVRTISKLAISERDRLLTVSVVANGFLYKMVRSIVGALVKVGEGRLTVEQLRKVINARKRTAIIETAPAHGLFLWKVFY